MSNGPSPVSAPSSLPHHMAKHEGDASSAGDPLDDPSGNGSKSDVSWNVRIEELRRYKEEHGNCLVPARYPPNRQLGHWVMTQRRQYVLMQEDKPSSLTKERVQQLNEIGFVWAVRENNTDVWDRRLKELEHYKAEHGDCLVPQRYPDNPPLGTWVNTQRRHYKLLKDGKRSSMTQERIRALEILGFEWKSPKDASKRRPSSEGESNPEHPPQDESEGVDHKRPRVHQSQPMAPAALAAAPPPPQSGMQLPQGAAALTPGSLQRPGQGLGIPPAGRMPMHGMPPMAPGQMNPMMPDAGQQMLPTGTWMCQFCRGGFMGTFMDWRAHEAQCSWRFYASGPPPPQAQPNVGMNLNPHQHQV